MPVTGKALSVGYVVLDVVLHDGGIGQAAGGTAGNVAANLAFLGWESAVAAQHGDDPAGKHLRADLERSGVSSTALLERPSMVTPVVIHEVLASTHRFRFGCPECGRRFPNFRPISEPFGVEVVERIAPDLLFIDRVSKAAVAMARFVRNRGGVVAFEPSTKSGSPRFRELVELAHVLKFSAERQDSSDPELQPGSAMQLQVVTDGAHGVQWRFGNRGWEHLPAFGTTVIDAGGAGDWTTAALLAALGLATTTEISDQDVREALTYAQAVAALSCQVIGSRGLSRVLGREELHDRVENLIASGTPAPGASGLPRKSRRAAACGACLA